MYSQGQMGFSIGDAWDGLRRFFGSGRQSLPTNATLTPGYQPTSSPFPVNELTAAGANITDIDNLATISDWASSVVAQGGIPSRERIPMLHAGELAALYGSENSAGSYVAAPDAVRAADQATRDRFGEWIGKLLVVHQYTALPANVSPLAQLGGFDTGSLFKWGAIALSAYALLPVLLNRNPRGRRRRRRSH
jgi:hypothetical protein